LPDTVAVPVVKTGVPAGVEGAAAGLVDEEDDVVVVDDGVEVDEDSDVELPHPARRTITPAVSIGSAVTVRMVASLVVSAKRIRPAVTSSGKCRGRQATTLRPPRMTGEVSSRLERKR
jgi:hypothetical protein